MGFTIEQECPQCGAPIELEETDHLLRCPYCEVKNFLFTPGYFRYVLPNIAPDKDIIYAPYLRFKGNVYFCRGRTVGYRVVDITNIGVPIKGVPMTLGIRTQAMKIKFVTPHINGSFLRFSFKAAEILARAARLSSASSSGKIFHQAYIGEALSIIYLPLFVEKNRLFDAVLNRSITRLTQGEDILGLATNKKTRWKINFIATLCPKCGWNLDGERDSVVLTCSNCETAWEVSQGKFVRVNLLTVPGQEEDTAYLPFWRISARVKGLEIESHADFIRLTNQPRVIQKEWEDQDVRFWSPAFKIRPKIFLKLSRQLTVSREHFQTEETIPKKNIYPVTLPRTEAIQSMKLILASSVFDKKMILPRLPGVRFETKESSLVYIPFNDTGHEMIQKEMCININKNTLNFGRSL